MELPTCSITNVIFIITYILITFLVILLLYYKWIFTYWNRRNIPQYVPSIPTGNLYDMVVNKVSNFEGFNYFYHHFKSKGLRHGGLYIFATPLYFPIDPELFKCILQKDFQYFRNKGFYTHENNDPLSQSLLKLKEEKWRILRHKLTPTFTTGKTKMMFPILDECTNRMRGLLEDAASTGNAIDLKQTVSSVIMDIISSSAFGLDINTIENPESDFIGHGHTRYSISGWDNINHLLQFILPWRVLDFFKYRVTKKSTEDFFMKIVQQTIEYREKNNIKRNDFFHLLLQLKNRGGLAEDGEILGESVGNIKMSIKEITAVCYGLFTGGFDTSSTTTTFALYELALNQKLQDKVRKDIRKVYAKHGKQTTYECIYDMRCLDNVINESLRMYPPVANTIRECYEDYPIPGTNEVLSKGTLVMLSVSGLHSDPENFESPEKYDPDRFTDENKVKIKPFTFLPFGEGPRVCIAVRFAMLQTKAVLATILKDYRVTMNWKTKVPVQFDKGIFQPSLAGGLWVNLEKVEEDVPE